MKIVFLDASTVGNDISLDEFNNFGEFIVYLKTSKEETISHIKDAQIVLTNKVVIDKYVMDKCKDLKLICITATGMNNVDLEYAKEKGIEVKNAAGYSTASVTQTTFTLVLSLLGKSAFYDNYVKSGAWSQSPIFTNIDKPYTEIKGKKWGIIGLGMIGKSVAKVADAFGANVCYYSTSGANNDNMYTRLALAELMSSCDIISIHAPLNNKTNNLIEKRELRLMKKGAMLINVGRGGIINEDNLANAIDTQDILVGIDVVSVEPINADNKLLHVRKKENLIMSPHIAWASKEARISLMKIVKQNIKNFIAR
jgi:glycerate dehydrogenase